MLDLDAVKKSIAVSEEDLRKYYAENEKRYTTPEERRASHILVKADKDAPKAERDKARAKAETLLAEVRKNPQSFAEVAKKNSDDEGSAAKGGDLDFFGRGAMVKPFEDAAFGLKPGEISGIVESDFGFHIIQVTGSARRREEDASRQVRPEIENEVRTQLAQKRFADAAVEFGDIVYEQSDSLKPAADKWKLEIKKAEHVTRVPAPGATGALANPSFLEALFSSDVDAQQAQHQGDRHRREPARCRPRRPVHAGAPVAVGRGQGQDSPATGADARPRRSRAKLGSRAPGRGARRACRDRCRSDTRSSRVHSRAICRRALLDAVLKAPAATLPAFVGVSTRRARLRGREDHQGLRVATRSSPIRARRGRSTRRSGPTPTPRPTTRR